MTKQEYIDLAVPFINRTIELHQMVIDGKYSHYNYAREHENDCECPLCVLEGHVEVETKLSINCAYCPWILFESDGCGSCTKYDYNNSTQSIERLNNWKQRLLSGDFEASFLED